jgi:hypothetical protein
VPPIADSVEARPAVIIAAALPSMMHDRVRSLFTFKLIARAPFWQRGPERELNHDFSLPEHNLYPFATCAVWAGRWWQPVRGS